MASRWEVGQVGLNGSGWLVGMIVTREVEDIEKTGKEALFKMVSRFHLWFVQKGQANLWGCRHPHITPRWQISSKCVRTSSRETSHFRVFDG
ncbi:hypothetical protein RvY_16555 [Ramazzottius varieornatus]|uniref:Uncharacterized protein n=1 Tax=Ramazzottius varieornatus TaxID=947166 RepID=A0A1D1VZP3_RAMVA|nr:hypothetical protein RvY_16555 [Ramazzottius varieornatus]